MDVTLTVIMDSAGGKTTELPCDVLVLVFEQMLGGSQILSALSSVCKSCHSRAGPCC